MAEVAEHMPSAGARGSIGKYPWNTWLDGQVWKLVQSVVVPDHTDETGAVVAGAVTEGDFTTDREKMRSYCKNAGKRRQPPLNVITRTTTEEVMTPGGLVKRVVFYLQAEVVSKNREAQLREAELASQVSAAQKRAAGHERKTEIVGGISADEGEALSLFPDPEALAAAQEDLAERTAAELARRAEAAAAIDAQRAAELAAEPLPVEQAIVDAAVEAVEPFLQEPTPVVTEVVEPAADAAPVAEADPDAEWEEIDVADDATDPFAPAPQTAVAPAEGV